MPTNFQYVPVSGDLSGKSFEEQTQHAFNELGTEIDHIGEISDQASAAAEQALNVAQQAQETASSAEATASSAVQTANEALSNTQNLGPSIAAAQDRADTAYALAEVVQTTAGFAQNSADAAAAMGNTAQEAADAAQITAADAKTMAQDAINGVNRIGYYELQDGDHAADANDYFLSPIQAYFNNPETTNLPRNVPVFMSVSVDVERTLAQQTAWGMSPGGGLFIRSGTVDNFDELNPFVVWTDWEIVGGGTPSGIITLWSGAVDGIPNGWILCDGQNGTPDLRDRFIVGAGNTYNVGATGGSNSHTHTATIGGTTLTVAQMPAHNHGQTIAGIPMVENNATGSSVYGYSATAGVTTRNQNMTTNTGASQSHTHSATNSTNSNLPPYYALCYIMKI